MTRRGETRAWLDAYVASLETDFTSECVLWPFSTNGGSGGRYPQIKIGSKARRVTHVIYERLTGRALELGELIRHWCDTPRCVNPFHFESGDHAANMRDMVKRLRSSAGQRNGRAKLTADAVAKIRALAREHDLRGRVSSVARAYGVSPTTIALVLAGHVWRDSARIDCSAEHLTSQPAGAPESATR